MTKIVSKPSALKEALVIPCKDDYLVGVLQLPTDKNDCEKLALFVVGGPQYRIGSHRLFYAIANALCEHGITSFRFDCRGMGDSTGEIRKYYQFNEDISAAILSLENRFENVESITLIGLCDGATAALKYAAEKGGIDKLILINPWVNSQKAEANAMLKSYYLKKIYSKDFWGKLIKGNVNVKESISSFAGVIVRKFYSNKDTSQKSNNSIENNIIKVSGEPSEEDVCEWLTKYNGNISVILSENDLTAKKFNNFFKTNNGRNELDDIEFQNISSADHTFSTIDSKNRLIELVMQSFF